MDRKNAIQIKANKTLTRILTNCGFHKSIINRLQTPTTARTQKFYALPKTHKPTLKIRPIVSACGGIFDRVSWLLQYILKPILKGIIAHITNTDSLLQRLQAVPPGSLANQIPVSFDVVSLYTNINANEAIDIALEYARKWISTCMVSNTKTCGSYYVYF